MNCSVISKRFGNFFAKRYENLKICSRNAYSNNLFKSDGILLMGKKKRGLKKFWLLRFIHLFL